MKRWYKYLLNYDTDRKFMPKDEAFEDHKRSMKGYNSSKGYSSKEDFFTVHFHGAHPRHGHYHGYLINRLKKEGDILSIGSGRCVNELLLMEEGFAVTCSDLEQPCQQETMQLFPHLKFMKYDVTKGSASRKFDSVISLSMFYLFDEEELLRVFKNVRDSLKSGGTFVFDPGGAENNLITRIIDDIICPSEMLMLKFLKKLLRRENCVVTKKHHGCRTTDAEIISIARRSGFDLCDMKKYDHFTEFGMRSIFFGKMPKKMVELLGRVVPYIRMFCFKKVDSSIDKM